MTIQLGNKYNGIPMGNTDITSGGNVTPVLVTELPGTGEEGIIYRVPVTDTSTDPVTVLGYKEYYWIEDENRFEEFGFVPAMPVLEWGNITGDITDQTDLTDYVANAITTSIGTMPTDIANLQTAVGNLQTAVGNLQTAQETLNTTVSSHTTTLGTINTAIETINASILAINTSLTNITDSLGGLSFRQITLSDYQDLVEAGTLVQDRIYIITDQDTAVVDGGTIEEESEEEPEEPEETVA